MVTFTAKQSNYQKGTTDYIGTTTQFDTSVAASEFGNPNDTYTAYDDAASPKKVSAIYVSVGTAWIQY
jgi:hypothetical protein